jgi:hypothetical protein
MKQYTLLSLVLGFCLCQNGAASVAPSKGQGKVIRCMVYILFVRFLN